MHLYDTLVNYDERSNEFVPGLAETWAVSSDGTEWTLGLRSGVTFHDGTEFSAESVAANFDFVTSDEPEIVSPFTLRFLAGYVETRVEDPLTAVVVFDRPNPEFLDGLSHPGLGIVSPAALSSGDPVGTGPFIFKDREANAHITLERNPDYAWGQPMFDSPGPANIDELVFQIIVEDGTRSAALERGEIDVAFLPYADFPRFNDSDDFQAVSVVRPGSVRALHYNAMNGGPLEDILVRQAVGHAIDRDAIAGAPFFGGAAIPARTPLSPNMPGYDEALEAMALEYDVDRANELLDEAGWLMTDSGLREKDGERLSLHFRTVQAFFLSRVGELIQSQLADVGIETRLELSPDFAALTDARLTGDFDLIIGGSFQADLGVLNVTYDWRQIGESPIIWSRYEDEELIELLDAASVELDLTERLALYHAAQERIMETVIMTPIYVEPYTFGMRNDLSGLRFSIGGEPLYHEARLP